MFSIETYVYSDLCEGTELRPIPRLSKAQTSIPWPIPESSVTTPSSSSSSSLGLLVPVNPMIWGPHDSCVPAKPERKEETFKHLNRKSNWNQFRREGESYTYDEKSFGRTMTVRSVEYLHPRIVELRLCVDVFFHNLAIRHRFSFCSMMFIFLRKSGWGLDSARGKRRRGGDENEEIFLFLKREREIGRRWIRTAT